MLEIVFGWVRRIFLETLLNNMWWCRGCLIYFFILGFWPQDSTNLYNSPAVRGPWRVFGHSSSPPHRALGRYTGAGHIIRISSKSWFISLIPFKKWNLYNVYIHSTQTDIFQVFIYFNFDDYKWQLMKTPNSVSQKIRILWKGSILKTPGATL